MEPNEENQKTNVFIEFWKIILADSYQHMVKFFDSSKDVLNLISSKFHITLILYLTFVGVLLSSIVLYIFMLFSLSAALAVNLFFRMI